MSIEFDSKTPIYVQIMESIKRDVVTGKLKGGDKLPSVRELSETFKVNPNTIQRTYQELERENITFTQRGLGTFITENSSKLSEIKTEMAKGIINSFINGMKQLGYRPEELTSLISEYLLQIENDKE